MDRFSPFFAPYELPVTAATALAIAVNGIIANIYNRCPDVNAAIPNSPLIDEMKTRYILIAMLITNMSRLAGIPTFRMSFAILESYLNSCRFTLT